MRILGLKGIKIRTFAKIKFFNIFKKNHPFYPIFKPNTLYSWKKIQHQLKIIHVACLHLNIIKPNALWAGVNNVRKTGNSISSMHSFTSRDKTKKKLWRSITSAHGIWINQFVWIETLIWLFAISLSLSISRTFYWDLNQLFKWMACIIIHKCVNHATYIRW